MAKYSEPEILARLPEAKGWEHIGDMLVRTWQFASPRLAVEFVAEASALAERMGHHPDIILSYRTVRVEISTHASGGLTDLDFALAADLAALTVER